MQKEPPIVECRYGWGRVLRLYADYLDVNGTYYALKDLTHVRSIYRSMMGISSVRLELHFGKQQVLLRGIAAVDDVQRIVMYLNTHYPGKDGSNFNSGWKRNRDSDCSRDRLPSSTPVPEECSPITSQDVNLKELAQAVTAQVPAWQRMHLEQRERRQRRLRIDHSLREHGFDVESLQRRLKEETLPHVPVPLHLLPYEYAHYSTDATLCSEAIGGSIRYTYPTRDQGTLIFTNRRIIYLGRRSQIVLDYARLIHISRLHGAIAFQTDNGHNREIFEVRRPLECTMYLECILQRYQQADSLGDVDTIPLSLSEWASANMMPTEECQGEWMLEE